MKTAGTHPAQFAGCHAHVLGHRPCGQHLLEQRALGVRLTTQIKRRIAQDLADHLALLQAHRRSPSVVSVLPGPELD